MLWVKRGAKIGHTRSISQEPVAFLQGDVATAYLPGTASAPMFRCRVGGAFGLKSVPPDVSVCITCPTDGGEHTCLPAVCTLATSCHTQVFTDSGCGGKLF